MINSYVPLAGRLFLKTAILAGVIGIALGLAMGMMHDFTLAPVHAHLNLVGWVSMFLFGLYYAVVPAADGRLALWHFGVAAPGMALLTGGIAGSVLGYAVAVPIAVIGGLLTLASMVLFAFVVRSTARAPRRTAGSLGRDPADNATDPGLVW